MVKRLKHLFSLITVIFIFSLCTQGLAADAPAVPQGGMPAGMPAGDGGQSGPPGMPGMPGGAGGPGGPDGNMGEESRSSEPVVSAAKAQLKDFDSVKNQDAVITVYDFQLMDVCSGKDKTRSFCPEKDLTLVLKHLIIPCLNLHPPVFWGTL